MPSTPLTYTRAKRLRVEQTSAEVKLWGALRNRRLDGFKFTRQMPIGPYIVDFICREHGVVIELDGATHGDDHEIAHDEKRTNFLNSKDLIVCRVNNLDVYQSIGSVLDGIHAVRLSAWPRDLIRPKRGTFSTTWRRDRSRVTAQTVSVPSP
jgi:very-short-patch-repair endonuclease